MKKHLLPIVSLLILVLFAGCGNWVIPKEIAISSEATFKIPVGDIPFDKILENEDGSLFDVLKPENLTEKLSTTGIEGLQLYQYTADKKDSDDDSLTYLAHYPLYNLSFGDNDELTGDYSNLNVMYFMDRAFEEMAPVSEEVDIPELKGSQKIDVINLGEFKNFFIQNLNSTLAANAFDVTFPEFGISTPQSLVSVLGENSVIDVTVSNATSIKYSEGASIEVKVTKKNLSDTLGPDYSLKLRGYVTDTVDVNNPLTGCDSGLVEVGSGGNVNIPFAGTMPNAIRIVIEAETCGGTWLNTHDYHIELGLKNFEIDKVEGVTATTDDFGITIPSINPTSIEVNELTDYFTSLKIKTGHISIKTLNPEGWEGVSCTSSVKFSGLGNAETEITDAADQNGFLINKYFDLADLVLIPTAADNKLVFSSDVDFVINNASFDFTKITADSKIVLEVDYAVDAIQEAVLGNLNTLIGINTLNTQVAVPSELGTSVKKISFPETKTNEDGDEIGEGKGYGFKFKVLNTFPEGNDLPLNIAVDYLDYNVNNVIPVTSDGKAKEVSFTKFGELVFAEHGENEKINISIGFPESIVLKDLVMGAKYSIQISDIEPVFDWNNIDINLTSELAEINIDFPNLDFTQSLAGMGLDCDLQDIICYCFFQKSNDDIFRDLQLTGEISLVYDGQETPMILYPPKVTNEYIGQIGSIGDINWPAEGKPFTQDLSKIRHLSEFNLADLINNGRENAKVHCNIGIASANNDVISLYSSSLNSLVNLGFSIDLALKLPLRVNLNSAIELDIGTMLNEDYNNDETIDLLNRDASAGSEGPSGGNGDGSSISVAEILEFVDYMSLKLILKNNIISVKDKNNVDATAITLLIEDNNLKNKNGESCPLQKEIVLSGKETKLEFTSEEIQAIINTPVFHPTIKLRVGDEDSTVYVNEAILDGTDGNNEDLLSANLLFELKLNGENPYIISLGGAE